MKRIIALVVCALISTPVSAQTFTLKKYQLYKSQGIGICGYVNNKWVPVAKSGTKYKKIAGSAELKSLCKSLLRKSNLSMKNLPDSSAVIAENRDSMSGLIVSPLQSGTPPTLQQIATTGASNVFWRNGVVSAVNSGSPSPSDCNELFGASADGSSSGFAGCYMAQETGYVMQSLIQSGTSLCYMKNFPTKEVQNDGGFSVIGGTLPGGDITKLFSVPSGSSPRYIKIHIGESGDQQEESIGIFKIYSQQQNQQNGDQYRYDLVFCNGSSNSTTEFEKTRVTLSGELITSSQHSQGSNGTSQSIVRAFLTKVNGELVVNPDLGRSIQFTTQNNNEGYKASISLNNANEIENKMYSTFGGSTRKGFSVSRFSGDGALSLRFLEGAYKELNSSFGNFSISTEYRDTYYAATAQSEFAERLSDVDFANDSFYANGPEVGSSNAPFGCNQDASVEIEINMSSSAMQAVSAICEAEQIEGMEFCHDTALREAQTKFGQVCTQ